MVGCGAASAMRLECPGSDGRRGARRVVREWFGWLAGSAEASAQRAHGVGPLPGFERWPPEAGRRLLLAFLPRLKSASDVLWTQVRNVGFSRQNDGHWSQARRRLGGLEAILPKPMPVSAMIPGIMATPNRGSTCNGKNTAFRYTNSSAMPPISRRS